MDDLNLKKLSKLPFPGYLSPQGDPSHEPFITKINETLTYMNDVLTKLSEMIKDTNIKTTKIATHDTEISTLNTKVPKPQPQPSHSTGADFKNKIDEIIDSLKQAGIYT